MWSENYSGHFDWCRRQPPQTVAAEAKRRIAALTECTERPAYCQRYANAAVSAQNANVSQRACDKTGARWSKVYAHHYNWCLGQPRAVAQREHDAREAELRNCSFQGAPKSPGSFAGVRIEGIELVRDAVTGSATVPVASNTTFLSERNLCGLWRTEKAALDRLIVQNVKGKGYKGFRVRSDARSVTTATCSARAQIISGGIRVDAKLPRNVLFFYMTTPGPLPGSTDPKFSVTYDIEASMVIRIPATAGQTFGVEGQAVITNIRPDSQNLTGDIAKGLAMVVDLFTKGMIRRQIPNAVPFKKSVEQSLGPIARAVPAGYRLEQRPNPNRPTLIIHATRKAPYYPPLR